MSTRPSVYRMRPVLITVLLALVAGVAWAAPAAAYDWRIDSIFVKPKLFAAEGTTLTIECPWSRSGTPSDETSGSVQILHSY